MDDGLVEISFVGQHVVDEELLFFVLEISEEEGVHKVKADHNLHFFFFVVSRLHTDSFSLGGEDLVGLGADTFTHLADSCLLLYGFFDLELLFRDLLETVLVF